MNPLFNIDFYKADHRRQYPEGTEYVYSNFTPRSSYWCSFIRSGEQKIVFAGLQGYVKRVLIDQWNNHFFSRPKDEVVKEYRDMMMKCLGPSMEDCSHIEDLHDLGFLPLHIIGLPEGSFVTEGTPVLTVINTDPRFFWLTNFIETSLSAELWKTSTSATIAAEYRRICDNFAKRTCDNNEHVHFQCHDFSARGMSGMQDAAQTGLGHLLFFRGTDTVAAIDHVNSYYYGKDSELVGASVPATEHSVMCMGTKESEQETFKRLICDTYPQGIVSIVSDTWDFWKVMTEHAPNLKDEIMSRDGKVVFRPDSGDPERIICGSSDELNDLPEEKGALQLLWENFGGTVNEKGFKVLDPHVGLIYGDSITIDRCYSILNRMEKMGFASSNIVFGVGSFTYQMNTRDTLGFAMKATWGQINGEGVDIFKDPVTDSGIKRSAKGILKVRNHGRVFNEVSQYSLSSVENYIGGKIFTNNDMVTYYHGELTEIEGRDPVFDCKWSMESIDKIRERVEGII